MQAVCTDVVFRPNESVEFAWRVAAHPQIGAPNHQRRFHVTPHGIVVQLWITLNLTLHDPACAEAGFVGVGLRAAARAPDQPPKVRLER